MSSGVVILLLLACQSGASLAPVQRRELVLEQVVDENVAAADFAREDAFSGLIEHRDQVPAHQPAPKPASLHPSPSVYPLSYPLTPTSACPPRPPALYYPPSPTRFNVFPVPGRE